MNSKERRRMVKARKLIAAGAEALHIKEEAAREKEQARLRVDAAMRELDAGKLVVKTTVETAEEQIAQLLEVVKERSTQRDESNQAYSGMSKMLLATQLELQVARGEHADLFVRVRARDEELAHLQATHEAHEAETVKHAVDDATVKLRRRLAQRRIEMLTLINVIVKFQRIFVGIRNNLPRVWSAVEADQPEANEAVDMPMPTVDAD